MPFTYSEVTNEESLTTVTERGSNLRIVDHDELRTSKSYWRIIPKADDAPKLTQNDSIYSWHMDSGAIVNEEYKLVFFSVAKAASTEWKLFLMRLSGLPEEKWCHYKTVHEQNINHFKHLRDYNIEEAQEMMTSPEWTRSIFVRHPKARILSAFLDKAVRSKKCYIRACYKYAKLCSLQENSTYQKDDNQTYTKNGIESIEIFEQECLRRHNDFSFFLYNVTTASSMNEHWRSSFSYIDEKWWPWINYIGTVEHGSDAAKSLLQAIKSQKDGISAWNRMGRTGWSGQERIGLCNGTDAFLDSGGNDRHSTHALDKMLQYYTPELEKFVEERYADDLNNPYFDIGYLKLFGEEGGHPL